MSPSKKSLRRRFHSESGTLFVDKPLHLQRSQSLPVLSNYLLQSERELRVKYKAALSQFIQYVESCTDQVDAEEQQQFLAKRKQLARNVLSIGAQLYAIYDRLTGQRLAQHQLAQELCVCELFTGTSKPKWQRYKDETDSQAYLSLDSLIRITTAGTNWYRLYFIRVKRLFVSLMPLIKSVLYQNFIHQLQTLDPALRYVAWMFYVPRLLANLVALFQAVIDGPWMTEETAGVPIAVRLGQAWSKLWFEILNDLVWCLVGLACCFVLDASHGLQLTVALYLFDTAMALANAYINIQHHNELRDKLDKKLVRLEQITQSLLSNETFGQVNPLLRELEALQVYRQHVDLWINYEQMKLTLSIQVTSVLLTGMVIGVLPTLFALNAVLATLLPILSSAIVVSICTWQYYQQGVIAELCPNDNILSLEHLASQMTTADANIGDETLAPALVKATSSDDISALSHAEHSELNQTYSGHPSWV